MIYFKEETSDQPLWSYISILYRPLYPLGAATRLDVGLGLGR